MLRSFKKIFERRIQFVDYVAPYQMMPKNTLQLTINQMKRSKNEAWKWRKSVIIFDV